MVCQSPIWREVAWVRRHRPDRRTKLVERRRHEDRQARLDWTKAEVAERIARVCAEMTPQEFDALVTRMANIEIKYAFRRFHDLVTPRIPGDENPSRT